MQKGSLFGGTVLKIDKIHLQENFWSHGIELACILHPLQLGKHTSPLPKIANPGGSGFLEKNISQGIFGKMDKRLLSHLADFGH